MKAKRMDIKLTDEVKSQCGTVAELYIDGKQTGFYAGHDVGIDCYKFDDVININQYPNLLEFRVSDIMNSVYLIIDFDREADDFKDWVKIKKLNTKLQVSYRFIFDDKNENLVCRALTLWHRVMSELEYIGFTELEDRISFEEGNISTNAQKTYTYPTLILCDLIKADVKIIDKVIKRVNK